MRRAWPAILSILLLAHSSFGRRMTPVSGRSYPTSFTSPLTASTYSNTNYSPLSPDYSPLTDFFGYGGTLSSVPTASLPPIGQYHGAFTASHLPPVRPVLSYNFDDDDAIFTTGGKYNNNHF